MIKKGEYVKAFKCYSDSLVIFRMEEFDKKGVWFDELNGSPHLFEWQFVTKLTREELDILGLEEK